VEGDRQITELQIPDNQNIDLERGNKTFSYDLCIVWNWEYDIDFISLLEKNCKINNLSLLQITPKNFESIFKSLINGDINFRVYLDRGSDVDLSFMPFVKWANEHGVYSINPYEKANKGCDKALMHPDFIYSGLYTPYTIILPSFNDQPVLHEIDLKVLGENFIIKPAHGSGGIGVVLKATTLNQVLEVRKEHPHDKYLLQANIVPREFNSTPAWFRVLYCGGHV
jgi:glutathione synthase/RimK-type ligase-like ATP-grasp enzyme